jgi:hypothetical protein
MFHPCHYLSCEVCGPVKKEHWKATVRYHLGKLPSGTPMWRFECSEPHWKRLRAQIRRRSGLQFHVAYNADADLYRVISTVPVTNLDGVEQITVAEAINVLCDTIDHLPRREEKGKVFFSSHAWKLLPEVTDQTGLWRCRGKVSGKPEAIYKVLNDHGIEPEIKAKKRFRWWGWWAWEFSTVGIDTEQLYRRLCGQPDEGEEKVKVEKIGPARFRVQLC